MRAQKERSRPTLGRRGLIVLVGLLGALGGWIYLSRTAKAPRAEKVPQASVLRHIPPGAMLVVTVDVAALRHTALGEQLLGEGRTVAGLGEVATICGEDPMNAVVELAIAIPDAAQDSGFGLFARGPVDATRLITCAEQIVAKRGGRPVRETAGRFLVLKDASLELSSAELAVREGGPVILAEPSYVRAALGTEGAESLLADAEHARLRSLVPAGQLTATAVLSAEQRRALIDELRAQDQADSPFRAVNGGALALSVTEDLELAVAIRCDSAAACSEVAAHIRRAAISEGETLSARAIGLDAALAKLTVETRGDAVHVGLSLPAADALTMLRRALALRKLATAPELAEPEPGEREQREPGADAGVEDAGVGGAPGERIEAPRDGGAP